MCAEIKARKLNVTWDCETRVDMVDKELLQTMHDAGCITVWFGVESGSEKILGANEQENKNRPNSLGFQDSSESRFDDNCQRSSSASQAKPKRQLGKQSTSSMN